MFIVNNDLTINLSNVKYWEVNYNCNCISFYFNDGTAKNVFTGGDADSAYCKIVNGLCNASKIVL